jgi:hypothetical protein
MVSSQQNIRDEGVNECRRRQYSQQSNAVGIVVGYVKLGPVFAVRPVGLEAQGPIVEHRRNELRGAR